jgi:hypothetical protein
LCQELQNAFDSCQDVGRIPYVATAPGIQIYGQSLTPFCQEKGFFPELRGSFPQGFGKQFEFTAEEQDAGAVVFEVTEAAGG